MDGQAIIPVPREQDDFSKIRYLTPSELDSSTPVTLSPFPTSWIILPTAGCPKGSTVSSYCVPQGLEEEWTCRICWPHFKSNEAKMLDLWYGEAKPHTPVCHDQTFCYSPIADAKRQVVLYQASRERQQYWLIQFISHDLMPIGVSKKKRDASPVPSYSYRG